uniref:Uncharacterized protein n=1 Tax=Rhipicephalus pulchellus TaxID=72859 RepID=L7LZ04_RHIPC
MFLCISLSVLISCCLLLPFLSLNFSLSLYIFLSLCRSVLILSTSFFFSLSCICCYFSLSFHSFLLCCFLYSFSFLLPSSPSLPFPTPLLFSTIQSYAMLC